MKWKVYFEDKEIIIEADLKVSVKILKNKLKDYLKIEKNHIELLSETSLLENEYILDESHPELFAFTKEISDEKEENKDENLEDILMKVTNAKTKIKAFDKKGIESNRFGDLDEFLNNSVSILSGNNLQNINIRSNNPLITQSLNENLSSLLNLRNIFSGISQGVRMQVIQQNPVNNSQPQQNNNSSVFNISSLIRPSSAQAQIEPNSEYVNTLVEMGFEEDRVRRALINSLNNMDVATEMLLNDEEDVVVNPIISASLSKFQINKR